MNFPDNPVWTQSSIDETKQLLTAYICKVKEQGKRGWITISSTSLHTECGSQCNITVFGRHLKQLNVPKKRVSTSIMYALFIE